MVYRGGRGQKAPYETVMVRCPLPVKQEVELLIETYKRCTAQGISFSLDSLPQVQQNSPSPAFAEAIELLEEALTLKANAGGAIKARIRGAIALLKGE